MSPLRIASSPYLVAPGRVIARPHGGPHCTCSSGVRAARVEARRGGHGVGSVSVLSAASLWTSKMLQQLAAEAGGVQGGGRSFVCGRSARPLDSGAGAIKGPRGSSGWMPSVWGYGELGHGARAASASCVCRRRDGGSPGRRAHAFGVAARCWCPDLVVRCVPMPVHMGV